MSLLIDLTSVSLLANPQCLGSFREHIDPAWIEQVLHATGTATVRTRRLPAEQVLWLVIGMALIRDLSIEEVVARLDLALPGRRGPEVAPSAIPQARERLGAEPVKELFLQTGAHWAAESARVDAWRNLAVYALDGTSMLVPDTLENRAHFGSAGGKRGVSGYPLVRVVALMSPRSHILAAARIGPYKGSSEASLARELFPQVPDNSLTLVDRNFLNSATLVGISRGGENRHWMTRAKSTTKWTVIRNLGPGDDLVRITVSSQARKLDPTLPASFEARAVVYCRKGFRPQTILTSLLDEKLYPAAELTGMYHERWEIEQGYDEIKTEMLGSDPTLRSKAPWSVEQELWGVLIAYNLVRLEMQRVARRLDLPPVRLSFIASIRFIREAWDYSWGPSPGRIPKRLEALAANLGRFVLRPRREERSYPRAVKVKMSNYARKRPVTLSGLAK